MANNMSKELRKKLRLIVIVIAGLAACIISVIINIVGLRQAATNSPSTSGMVGLSTRAAKPNNQTQKEEKDEKIKEESILVNALPVIKLNNNSWDRMNSNFSDYQTDENGNLYFTEGYTIYCNKRSVTKVVFDETYTGETVGRIKVGTDLKDIQKTLGTPTFKLKDCIGYKTREVYVFYKKDEISVYPNMKISNQKFEELLNSYFEKTYGKDRTYFLVDIRNNFDDFEIEMDEENDIVTIKSLKRQVIAELGSLGDIEVEFYNGYQVALDSTQEHIDSNDYRTNEKDLINITESERIKEE